MVSNCYVHVDLRKCTFVALPAQRLCVEYATIRTGSWRAATRDELSSRHRDGLRVMRMSALTNCAQHCNEARCYKYCF